MIESFVTIYCPRCGDTVEVPVNVSSVDATQLFWLEVKFETQKPDHACSKVR